ncbi:hypothetical protein TRVA0_001S04302 [Trichomonascus vanleenenianus]|uniref:uncharacterized protein n=1 Tax=Trichomonascus vanleenenianus TaxID=2268995 RepID=UPI003ECA458D
MSAVTVKLSDLESGSADHLLPDAFGPDSLGIIVVEGMPEKYKALRQRVLQSASRLSQLPAESLAKLEAPEAYWLVGWSCGKEKLASGRPDELKGSFYVNCAFHNDPKLEGPTEVPEEYSDLKGYTAPNLWPSEKEMPQFEADLKELCNLIIDTAETVARACDRYVSQHTAIENYEPGYLERIVKTSTTTKARLLHYFATDREEAPSPEGDDDWCGEHLDHSCLTGLTSAMFIREPNDEVLPGSPDPDAGLYIKDRAGRVVKVSIPQGALAFQTGEALEKVTNGQFKAVPHYVKGSKTPRVCRNTLAVFCQPSLHEKVGDSDFATFSRDIITRNH